MPIGLCVGGRNGTKLEASWYIAEMYQVSLPTDQLTTSLWLSSTNSQGRSLNDLLSYNAVTANSLVMTNDELQQAIAANTAAINALVTQFIRPNAQQALENQRSIAQMLELMARHAQAIVQIDERLEANTQQIAANSQQIAALGDRLEQFDTRLEETRALVADNASNIAQMGTMHDQMFERLDTRLDRTDAQINVLIEENRAFRESQQSQLAAIIGNGRRIDRLEQQAS